MNVEAAIEELRELGADSFVTTLDATDEDAIRETVTRTVEEFGASTYS